MTISALDRHDHLLSEKDAAAFLGLSTRTMQSFRISGLGPAYCRLGLRRIGFLHSDLLAFAAQRRYTSTSHESAQKAGAAPPQRS